MGEKWIQVKEHIDSKTLTIVSGSSRYDFCISYGEFKLTR